MARRLNKVTRDFNIGISTAVKFLQKKGHTVEANPNTKISEEQYELLLSEFGTEKIEKQSETGIKVVGKIDLDALNRLNSVRRKEKSDRVKLPYREDLNTPNYLFHILLTESSPLENEDYIHLYLNEKGYYNQLPTLIYNSRTSVLYYTIEEEDNNCSLYRIVERIQNIKLKISEDDLFILKGDNTHHTVLENLFDNLPFDTIVFNMVKEIHFQLLYPNGYIRNINWGDSNRQIILALKSKPFIILSGLSGTGKSSKVVSLAKSFYNLSHQFNNKYTLNYCLQTVKPNWFDSTELLGYISPSSQHFIDTEFLRFVKRAEEHPNTPHFVCLDEMNLARVEYYFAEILSKIEMRSFNAKGKYESICISENYSFPSNLFIIGTVNMDDTTNSFSKKVLDRAMIFETPIPDLKEGLSTEEGVANDILHYSADILLRDNIDIQTAYKQLAEAGEKLIIFLIECNQILLKTPFGFAYRLRNESLTYLYHNFRIEDKPENWFNICIDEILTMKILPRIEGDRPEIKQCLLAFQTLSEKDGFKHAQKKIEEMLVKFESLGYTSYFN